jgi:LysM repeat protein
MEGHICMRRCCWSVHPPPKLSSSITTEAGSPTSTPTSISIATTTAASTGPSPTQSGIASNCVTYYQVQSGDRCWSIVNNKYTYLTQNKFIEWNPAVGSSCTLWANYYYCVAVKGAQPMPKTTDSCITWHLVVDGDTCYAIGQQYSITAEQFNSWNPMVGTDCASLWLGYYVCVGV